MINEVESAMVHSELIAQAREAFASCENHEGVNYISQTGAICIRESITRETSSKFQDVLAQADDAVKFIVVSGPGGQLTPALDMTEVIRSRDIPVVVGDVCASSCAQFLFVGAHRKVLLSSGVAAFHGGPLSETQISGLDVPDTSKDFLRAENARFADFYRSIGVDMSMLTSPPPHIAERLGAGEFVMWTWPVAKLREFGVQGLFTESESP